MEKEMSPGKSTGHANFAGRRKREFFIILLGATVFTMTIVAVGLRRMYL